MPDERPVSTPTKSLAKWQVVLVVVSIIVAASGLGLMVYQAMSADETPVATEPTRSTTPGTNAPSGFAPAENEPDAPATSDAQSDTDRLIDSASGAVFRLGFGFFAGFAIGYAVRAFVKASLIVVGIGLLALFGLQYAGLITVDWERVSGGFETFGSWATAQTKDFANFITGYLPSAGAGLAGAFVGLRRK
jgi:uncharacterized membrane protein (Fun14 family)